MKMKQDSGKPGETLSLVHADLLAKVDLFAQLDSVTLAKLAAYVEPFMIKNGATVCRQGDPGDCLFIIAKGKFGVFVSPLEGMGETRLSTMHPPEYFGEMALLTNDPRSATVRAEWEAEVLKLDRAHFLGLLKDQPAMGLSIISTLCRRLRTVSQTVAESNWVVGKTIDHVLSQLSAERRRYLFEASILDELSMPALHILFGPQAEMVAQDLAKIGIKEDKASIPILGVLRERFRREAGIKDFQIFAQEAASRLADAQAWDDALSVLSRYGQRSVFISFLGRALRAIPPLPREQAIRWVERLTDEEAAQDTDLALTKASFYELRGNPAAASTLLRHALGTALLTRDPASARRATEELARLGAASSSPPAGGFRYGFQVPIKLPRPQLIRNSLVIIGVLVLLATAIMIRSGGPQLTFLLLLGAAVVLWVSDLFPASAVGLGLVVAWVLLGLADLQRAVGGFGSMDWIFVFAIFGIAAAIARSGLLFRAGLLLVRRMPRGLFAQAALLLLTGIILSPLLPNNIARASLTAPLAVAVAEASRLRDREPAAAVLGLAAWIGSGAMAFLFLNSSQFCLLAWGLLPKSSQNRFDWIQWLVAAAPLGVFVGIGMLIMLFLVLRPRPVMAPSREGVNIQLALLGPVSPREKAMIAVLILTLIGWLLAPKLQVDFATVTIIGLLGTVFTGNFNRQALQELDWNYLIFYGVALSMSRVAVSLGLDRLAADAIGTPLLQIGTSSILFILAVACLNILVRFILLPSQSVLLLSLALIPVAPKFGVDPWVVIVTILSTSFLWFPPSQLPAYLAAYSASEGRLFSHEQSARINFVYIAITLAGLALSTWYWRFLGLL